MLGLAAMLAIPTSGILVVDGLGVGICQNGAWKSMDSIASNSWPKQTVETSAVNKLTSGPCFLLKENGSTEDTLSGLKFVGDDGGPGERGWILDPPRDDQAMIWFGAKPATPKVTYVSGSNKVYSDAVKSYLTAKGWKNPQPILTKVAVCDLDGNGNDEVLIFASSRKTEDMSQTLALMDDKPTNMDYSLALVRYISGKTVKTTTMYYEEGKRRALGGYIIFGGLFQLDGKPGLNIITKWGGYEAWGSTVSRFANGKVKDLAESGDGV